MAAKKSVIEKSLKTLISLSLLTGICGTPINAEEFPDDLTGETSESVQMEEPNRDTEEYIDPDAAGEVNEESTSMYSEEETYTDEFSSDPAEEENTDTEEAEEGNDYIDDIMETLPEADTQEISQMNNPVLTAETEEDIQWQIMIPGTERWVSIANETDSTITLTIAKTLGMADEQGNVYIRCITQDGDEVVASTEMHVNADDQQNHLTVLQQSQARAKKAPRSNADLLGIDGNEEAETYNIVVNFLFLDGTLAQDPLIATVAAGDDFNQTIEIQQFQGYESFVGDTAVTTLDLNYTDIERNIIVNVYYHPALVEYRVEHYWQNVYDNGYTLHESETFEGYTGDLIEKCEKNYGGMYTLLYDQPVIAADGSTILGIYYDRYYYLIDYNLDGGRGVDPIYARFGSTINQPDPTKPGYSFAGWSPAVPETIPIGGGTYTALWNAEETTYNILYWYENTGPSEEYSLMAARQETALSGTEISDSTFRNDSFEGRDDTFFYYNTEKSETYTISGDGTTNVNVYFRRQPITMTFKYDNGEQVVFTGKYESTFSQYGYRWPDDTFWRYVNTSGGYTGMTFMDAFIPTSTMPDKLNITFTETSRTGHVLTFYRQQLDGSYRTGSLDTADVTVASNGTFTITEKYEGFSVRDYRRNDGSTREFWTIGSENGEEYTGEGYYQETTSTSSSNTYYGIVDGEVVQLVQGIWIDENGNQYTGDYKYQVSSATSGSLYGVIDGKIVYPVTYTYGYSYDGEDYIGTRYATTTSTSSGNTYYGVVNGELVKLTRRTSGWSTYFYDPDNNRYTGTRYIVTTSSSNTSYAFINGEMVRLTRSQRWRYEGATYNGTRYTQTSATVFPTSGTYYGFVNGEMVRIYADTSQYRYNGQEYNGTRYTMETDPSSSGIYYGPSQGEMQRLYYRTERGGWSSWSPAIAGSTTIPNNDYTYQIRYTRNKYKLQFYNYDMVINERTKNIYYEASLSGKDFTPPYPEALPYGKYEFAGWYDNEELVGTPFNFDTTMPAHNVTLFAKYQPKSFNVKIYRDLMEAQAGEDPLVDGMYEYGTLVPTPSTPSHNERYSFIGWFYRNEDGDELPYQFSTMTVAKDMVIYGKWSSDVLVAYQISYEDEEGNTVADPFLSSALEGSTKTFKAESDLYDEFAEGYFPLVSTHSIMFSSERDNDYTFVYRYMGYVPYTVRYLNARTGDVVKEEKVVTDNKKIAVTEKFAAIPGYVPDRYQKSLIVQAGKPEENVITFYYTPDTRHAYYLKAHYIETLNGTYKLYNALDTIEDLGTEVSISPIDIEGYTYDEDNENNVKTGVVTFEGTELKLYYNLNEYNYRVRYLDAKTNAVLHEEKIASAKFSANVHENSIAIDGYNCLTDSPQSITITKDNEYPIRNVITFYYQVEQAQFNYVAVGLGSVDNMQENVSVTAGTPDGSTPSTIYDSEFIGWYLDREGTIPVTPDIATIDPATNHLVPVKHNVDGREIFESTTFYARFNPLAGYADILKRDGSTETPLSGAILQILTDDGNETVIEEFTSLAESSIYKLGIGNYILREVTAPTGYDKAEDIHFTIEYTDFSEEEKTFHIVMDDEPIIEREITLTKRIRAEDILYDHGTPTFIFEIEGTDIYGHPHKYTTPVQFDQAFVSANTSDGYVELSTTVSGIPGGIYTVSEISTSRYELTGIDQVTSGSVSGSEVVFDLRNVMSGTARFTNAKAYWDKLSDNAMVINKVLK